MKPGNTADNFGRCACTACPLFTECNRGNGDRIFCARKPSICDMDDKKICICPNCPVYVDNALSGAYFCKIEIRS